MPEASDRWVALDKPVNLIPREYRLKLADVTTALLQPNVPLDQAVREARIILTLCGIEEALVLRDLSELE